MNKNELISAVAEKSGLSKKDSEKALNAALETITATVAAGDKVQLIGFGTFAKTDDYLTVPMYGGQEQVATPELTLRSRFLLLRFPLSRLARLSKTLQNNYG